MRTAAPLQPVNRAAAMGLALEEKVACEKAAGMECEWRIELQPARPVGLEVVADNGGGGSGVWEGR